MRGAPRLECRDHAPADKRSASDVQQPGIGYARRIQAVLFAGGLLLGASAFFAPGVSHAAQERASSTDLSAQQHPDVKEEEKKAARAPRHTAARRSSCDGSSPGRTACRCNGTHRARSRGRKQRRMSCGSRQSRRDTLFCRDQTLTVATVAACGVAFAEAPTPAPPPSSIAKSAAQVETWTSQQWEAAKATWAQNTTRWAACQKQSGARKLEGRDYWSFLYSCMTG